MIKDLAYYLTLFKIEGHTTWRIFTGPRPDSFAHMWKLQTQGVVPKVTEQRTFRVDRETGLIEKFHKPDSEL